MKHAVIQQNNDEGLPSSRLLCLLEVSKSSYYAWLKRKPSKRDIANNALREQIAKVYWQHQGRYGYRRIYEELLESFDYKGSRERIRRQMRVLGLKAIIKRRFKVTTDSHHKKVVAPNLLKQNFAMGKVNQAWVGDITYIRVSNHQWVYLTVVMDLYSRKIIGWEMNKLMKADLVCDALTMALSNRSYPEGVIIHTDRGSQYCSKQYQRLIKENHLICSMSGKGNCYDNVVCESFFHTLKTEHVHRFNYETREQAKRSVFWYIEAYYNRIRRHSGIDYQSPINFEERALKNAS